MRLTVDVVLSAAVSINPLKERELNLRGLKLPAIENLGVTKDAFDCIDFSENEIKKVENFPRSSRLRMLLFQGNLISRISDKIGDTLPSLVVLSLQNNKIKNIVEIDNLSMVKSLQVLSLMGNPICGMKFYRLYVISKFPKLRVLDFHKVTPKEKSEAKILFASSAGQAALQEMRAGVVQVDENVDEAEEYVMVEKEVGSMQVEETPPVESSPAKSSPAKSSPAKSSPAKSSPVKSSPSKSKPPPPPAPVQEEAVKEESPDDMEIEQEEESNDEMEMDESKEAPVTPPSKEPSLMKVTELKEELRKRDLPTNGVKAILLSRLEEAL